MDVNLIVTGSLIYIAPVSGDTTTAWSRPQKTEHIGHANKGECYKAGKVNVELGMVELVLLPGGAWPDSLHPLAWGSVWVDARFVSLTDPIPAPVPDPTPVPGNFDAAIEAGVVAFCEAFLAAYWGE